MNFPKKKKSPKKKVPPKNSPKALRNLMCPKGVNIKIITKIENQERMENYEEIISVNDGIMVARETYPFPSQILNYIRKSIIRLGMEIAPQKIFLSQK